MAKKALVEKAKRPPKYSTRIIRRCQSCNRPRAYQLDFWTPGSFPSSASWRKQMRQRAK